MSWAGVAAAGGAIVGGYLSSQGSQNAAQTQANAQEQAAQTQLQMFGTTVGQEQPFLQGGYGAQFGLNNLLGIGNYTPATTGTPATPGHLSRGRGGEPGEWIPGTPAIAGTPASVGPAQDFGGLPAGYLTQTFNPTMDQLQNYPGYQFQLQQGDLALQSQNAATTGALSGPALKSLMSYNQGLAASNYQNYFNQFQTQQSNIYNRLMEVSQLGQNAAGNLGGTSAQLGTGIAQAQAAAGASLAAGQIGSANAYAGAASSIPLYAMLARGGVSASGNNLGGFIGGP